MDELDKHTIMVHGDEFLSSAYSALLLQDLEQKHEQFKY